MMMTMKSSASICSNSLIFYSRPSTQNSHTFSPFLVKSMATPKPVPSVSRTVASKKNTHQSSHSIINDSNNDFDFLLPRATSAVIGISMVIFKWWITIDRLLKWSAVEAACFLGTKVEFLTVTKSLAQLQNSTVFPLGEQPRSAVTSTQSVKLLTRMEQLRLLTKAEKAGLLSAAEKAGLSLSTIEKLGLLSKAEELGVLSSATDPSTPGSLFTLSFVLFLLGPLFVYLVPEDNVVEVGLQAVVALFCVVGGSAGFAGSSFVSNLQKIK